MGLDAVTIIGFIGALVLLVAFLLNQLGHWETTDFEYDFINLIGAALLAIYGWQIGSWPIIILFAVWTLFSFKDVIIDGLRNMKKGKEEKKKEEAHKEAQEAAQINPPQMEEKKEEAPSDQNTEN